MANHPHGNRHNSNNERGGVRADPRAIKSRQRDVGGQRPTTPSWSWTKPGEPTERACMHILQGKVGMYPIFGVQLAVEERHNKEETFPALVFYGAKPDPEGLGLCGALKEGFWIGVSELHRDPSQGFKDEEREILIQSLMLQPEMQFSVGEFRKEQSAAREAERQQREEQQQKMKEKRQKLLANLRNPTGSGTSPIDSFEQEPESTADKPKRTKSRPVLATFEEILAVETGSIVEDGLEIYISRSPQGGNAVRLKTAPEGHELSDVATKMLFIDQNSLAYSDDRPSLNPGNYVGNDKLRYMFRMWLRKRLQLKGVTLHQPVEYIGTNGAGNHSPEESEGNALGAEVSSAG